MKTKRNCFTLAALVAIFLSPIAGQAAMVRVTVENLAPANGTFQTPVWVGFHNGLFDLYDSGVAASAALERIAEDGNTGPLMTSFTASGAGGMQDVIFGPGGPIAPGEMGSADLSLNPLDPQNRYFSYASMVIPSNDAFIANGNPLAFEIFDAAGNFLGADFVVFGSQILDAGTVFNDEIPANTAFFGQAVPDTGVNENGVVGLHPGFFPAGSGGILDDAGFANADFKQSGYQAVRIRVSSVPDAGATFGLMGLALATLGAFGRAQRPKSH